MTRELARALVEAGYLGLPEYIRLLQLFERQTHRAASDDERLVLLADGLPQNAGEGEV